MKQVPKSSVINIKILVLLVALILVIYYLFSNNQTNNHTTDGTNRNQGRSEVVSDDLLPGWVLVRDSDVKYDFILPEQVTKAVVDESEDSFSALYASESDRFYMYIFDENQEPILFEDDHKNKLCTFNREKNVFLANNQNLFNCEELKQDKVEGFDEVVFYNHTAEVENEYVSVTIAVLEDISFTFVSKVDAIEENEDEEGRPDYRLQLIPLNLAEILVQDFLANRS